MKVSDLGPYALVPEWLLDAPVSDRAARLWAILARYTNHDSHSAWPSRATLAKRLRCSVDTLDRAMTELVDLGAIEKERRSDDGGRQTSNLYSLRYMRPGGREPAALVGRTDAARSRARTNETHPPTGDAAGQPQGMFTDPQPDPQSVDEGPTLGQRAQAVVAWVWERADPKPSVNYGRAVSIAKLLLGAGHPDGAVQAAMLSAPTITAGTVEFQLNRKRPGAPDPARQPTQNRDLLERFSL